MVVTHREVVTDQSEQKRTEKRKKSNERKTQNTYELFETKINNTLYQPAWKSINGVKRTVFRKRHSYDHDRPQRVLKAPLRPATPKWPRSKTCINLTSWSYYLNTYTSSYAYIASSIDLRFTSFAYGMYPRIYLSKKPSKIENALYNEARTKWD